ncbi:MAG TPA: hypothetical protein ENK55_12090 [Actinobacteria bacterium]|nr:hypothetical protein [Actinomycetota bacterium]
MRPAALILALLLAACGAGSVFALEPGMCFDDPADLPAEIAEVELVACDEPHDNEVIAVVTMPDGPYPGAARAEAFAEEACLDAFEPYVGVAYEASPLVVSWLTPTAESWDRLGDREVVCIVFDASFEKLEGTVAGSGA